MSKVYTSAIVIIPPKEKQGPIQEIRKKYDRQINRWMPHINLIYPFRPNTEYLKLEKKFLKVCEKIESFEISLKNFKYFHHGHQHYTILLDPEPNDLIIKLQAKILKIVPDCNDVNKHKNGFTPHLSVGQIKGKNKLTNVIKILQYPWKERKFVLNEIYFISRENSKSSRFFIDKKIPLKN